MVALNFSPLFVPQIEDGIKCQTIRVKPRTSPGEALQLYTGQRTKECRKIGDAICRDVSYVSLTEGGLVLDQRRFPMNMDEFARLDGFENYASMWKWFATRYQTTSFTGYVIRWRDLWLSRERKA